MFSLICAWMNGWVNNCEAGDLSRHRAHYDVTVMVAHGATWSSKYLTQNLHVSMSVLFWMREWWQWSIHVLGCHLVFPGASRLYVHENEFFNMFARCGCLVLWSAHVFFFLYIPRTCSGLSYLYCWPTIMVWICKCIPWTTDLSHPTCAPVCHVIFHSCSKYMGEALHANLLCRCNYLCIPSIACWLVNLRL